MRTSVWQAGSAMGSERVPVMFEKRIAPPPLALTLRIDWRKEPRPQAFVLTTKLVALGKFVTVAGSYRKLATIVSSRSMTRTKGLSLLLASPDQLENAESSYATAVRVTTERGRKKGASGSCKIVPAPWTLVTSLK